MLLALTLIGIHFIFPGPFFLGGGGGSDLHARSSGELIDLFREPKL